MNPKRVLRLTTANAGYAKQLFRAIEAETQPDQPNAPDQAEQGFNHSLNTFNFLASHSFWFLVGMIHHEPVGYATVIRIPKADDRLGVLYVDEVHVLKAHRRQGVGKALLAEVHRIATELQLWRIRLNADPHDPGGRRFYEADGFQDNGDGFFEKAV